MPLNMEQVLEALETNEDPKEAFVAGLQDNGTEKTAESDKKGKKEVEAPETQTEVSKEDLAKVAEADAQGRIMARAFYDELQKAAVAPVADYPADPAAIPNNPSVEVARGDPAQPQAGKSSKVNAIIAGLTAATKVGAGEITTPAGPAPEAKVDPQDGNAALAADVAKAQERAAVPGVDAEKQAAARIVTSLYNKYFPEDK